MTGIALAVSFLVGAVAGGLPGSGGWAVATVALVGIAAVSLDGSRRLLVPATLAVLAATLGVWRAAAPPDVEAFTWADAAKGVRGRVATVPAVDGRRQHLAIEVAAVQTGETWTAATGRVMVSAPLHPRLRHDDQV